MINGELLALAAGLLLTLFIYSYLLGDNWFYRVAIHMLVGVSAAYAAVVAIEELFVPLFMRLREAPSAPENLMWLIPMLLSLLLLLTWFRPLTWLGNSAVGLLVGTGAAVALVGVIAGTLIPQVISTPGTGPVWQLVIGLLTIFTLLYFQFTGREDSAASARVSGQRVISAVGRGLLMVTFGALFASAFTTSLVLLADRLSYFMGGLMEFADLWLP